MPRPSALISPRMAGEFPVIPALGSDECTVPSKAGGVSRPAAPKPGECLRRSLVQPLLSSSHQGYGVSSLDTDSGELHLLAKCLRDAQNSSVNKSTNLTLTDRV
jgi:hypothetical protein